MTALFRLLPGLFVLFVMGANALDNPSLRVFVGIAPIQYLVERVGGERVRVTVLVPGGQRPETYEPFPRQIAGLAEANIFFGVGMPLEREWKRQLRLPSATGGPDWVDLSTGLDRGGEAAPAEPAMPGYPDHAHGKLDPHVWLNPAQARRMSETIRDLLIERDPANDALYKRGAAALGRNLEALDGEIRQILSQSEVDTFLVFHPAWGHFARAYGLRQLAIEAEGKEPGPRAMIEIIHRAQEMGVRTVFVDPRHGTRLAETVAKAIGARIEMLDPLANDYPENLRRAALAIAGSH